MNPIKDVIVPLTIMCVVGLVILKAIWKMAEAFVGSPIGETTIESVNELHEKIDEIQRANEQEETEHVSQKGTTDHTITVKQMTENYSMTLTMETTAMQETPIEEIPVEETRSQTLNVTAVVITGTICLTLTIIAALTVAVLMSRRTHIKTKNISISTAPDDDQEI